MWRRLIGGKGVEPCGLIWVTRTSIFLHQSPKRGNQGILSSSSKIDGVISVGNPLTTRDQMESKCIEYYSELFKENSKVVPSHAISKEQC